MSLNFIDNIPSDAKRDSVYEYWNDEEIEKHKAWYVDEQNIKLNVKKACIMHHN